MTARSELGVVVRHQDTLHIKYDRAMFIQEMDLRLSIVNL
jgi:hypothetical protein